MTDADKEVAQALLEIGTSLSRSSPKAVLFDFSLGAFGYGILAIGAVHFVIG